MNIDKFIEYVEIAPGNSVGVVTSILVILIGNFWVCIIGFLALCYNIYEIHKVLRLEDK